MARRVRDANLETREARSRLKPRGKPYWRSLERGLHLDYRRLRGKPGTWNVRHYLGDQRYEIKQIGIADDLSDADGVAILDIWQAQTAAREQMVKRAHAAGGKTIGPFTVADAYREYLEALKHEGKHLYEARLVGEVFVYPAFGDIGGEALTEIMLKRWLTDLVQQPPRVRTKKGAEQNYREAAGDAEYHRKRRNTANRYWAWLRRALNQALAAGKINSAAWRHIKPFAKANAPRVHYLTVAEDSAKQFLTDLLGVGPCRKRRCRGGCGS